MDKRHPVRKALTGAVELSVRLFGRRTPAVSVYELAFEALPEAFDGCRFVQLSDLHGRLFGPGQSRLKETLRALAPDYILITGDLVEDGEDVRTVPELMAFLAELAPTFFAPGNHETRLPEELREALYRTLREAGVCVLSGECAVLKRGGQTLALGGVFSKPDSPLFEEPGLMTEEELRSLQAVREQAAGRFLILMAHRPECCGMSAKTGASLIFSGHAHGGLMPLPGGALLAPGQGWFPKRVRGIYRDGDSEGPVSVVSAGLGGPRILVKPEIVSLVIRKSYPQRENGLK